MATGRAKLAMAHGLSVWVLEAPGGFGDARFHAHHALQITLSLTGSLRIADEAADLAAAAIAVAADARHRFEADGLLVFLFVEPESPVGRALAAELFANGPLAAIDAGRLAPAVAPLMRTFEAGLGSGDLLAAGHAALAAIAPAIAPPLADPRIRRIIDQAFARPGEPMRSVAVAAGVHLSDSRLRHLFVEQTGLAFKTYMLWVRMVRALQVYADGRSLTEAAHAAGFADSAHFSRIFKRTFGLPATTLARL